MARSRTTADEQREEWERWKAEQGSSPSSLFKNEQGRAAYDALMPAPTAQQPWADGIVDGSPQATPGAWGVAPMQARTLTPEQQALVARERIAAAELRQRQAEADQRYDIQGRQLGLEQYQADQRYDLDFRRAGAAALGEDLDREMRNQQFQQTGQQRAYEYETGRGDERERFQQTMGQRGYEYETGRQDEVWKFQAAREQREQELAQQRQFQAQEMQARHAMQLDLMQQELSQGEKLRLQKLKSAKAHVQEQVESGSLTAQEGADLMTQLDTGINPLVNRQARSAMMHQEVQNKLLMEQAAKQASMDQMNRSFMAKGFGDRVGTWVDPDTGHKFRVYESSPGKYDILPDREAEAKARQMEMDEKKVMAEQKAEEARLAKEEKLQLDREKKADSMIESRRRVFEAAYKEEDARQDYMIRGLENQLANAEKTGLDKDKVAELMSKKGLLEADRQKNIGERLKQRGMHDSPASFEDWAAETKRRMTGGETEEPPTAGAQQGQQEGTLQKNNVEPPAGGGTVFDMMRQKVSPEQKPAVDQLEAMMKRYGSREAMEAAGVLADFDRMIESLRQGRRKPPEPVNKQHGAVGGGVGAPGLYDLLRGR